MTHAAGKRRSGLVLTLAAIGGLGACAAAGAAPAGSATPAPTQPTVLYTDIASGPNSGGENGNGAYLSIFGRNFGAAGLGSRVKVTIGGVEVASYRYLGPSKGRSDVQQITVQVGALTGQALGTPLPVQVNVAGQLSNNDQTFTINPGRILFVDNVHGVDATAVPGDINHPYRHVQLNDTSQAAFGAMRPGDFLVLRGTGTAWTDLGNDTYFVKFIHLDGSAPTGSTVTPSGPLTLMGYPNEDVFIDVNGPATQKGAISGIDTTQGVAGGHWVTIADLRIESGGNAGAIATQIDGDHWRIVNNELSAATATNTAKAAGINGNATNAYWYGNHIHDIAGGSAQENHGIYIDGDGSYDIAYNHIEHVSGGNGFQIFVNGGNGSDFGNHVHFHHNRVHDVSKHGLNIADGAQNDIALWDNVVYNVQYSGLRFNTNTLHGARIYNNTLYNVDIAGVFAGYAGISNDWNFPADALDLRNNIVVPAAGQPYTGGSVGIDTGIGTISNNLWFGGAGDVSFDTSPVQAAPGFIDATAHDFHLHAGGAAVDAGTSAVAALATTDYDAVVYRPSGAGYDIGAFEYVAGYAYDRIFADGFQ